VKLTRREFLKYSAAALAGLAVFPRGGLRLAPSLPEFPQGAKLGRICAGGEGARFELKTRPYMDAPAAGTVYRDEVVVWLREVVTSRLDLNRISQTWIETPNGYLYAPYVQPVKNLPNAPLTDFPGYSTQKPGMWVEVTVPYVDFTVENAPRSPWLKETLKPRLYYSQVLWADRIQMDDQGKPVYRLTEKYGGYDDAFWASAEAFRPITPDELTPISPDVMDKRIEVSLLYQTLSCYEGSSEVYFCRVSTGYGDATPVGSMPIWRKMISTHMSGGSTGAGFDTPGIGWTCLFSNDGAAIHSTFWHNEFGLARTHGCVNTLPEDAKWIFRWTYPSVTYDPGDVTISGMNGSPRVVIKDV